MALVANPLVFPPTQTEITYASPVYRRSSDSQSVRSRRTGRSSSDSSTRAWDGFIEEDLRAGGPYLPEPPCHTSFPKSGRSPIPDNAQASLMDGIINLGRREGIRIEEIQFCFRSSMHDSSSASKFTCKLLATKQHLGQPWIGFARKVREYLHQQGVNNIAVEMLDPRFFNPLSIAPCTPSDAIFHRWNEVLNTIEHKVSLRGINTISCHRIGMSRNSMCPMVILGVDHKETRNWTHARENIVDILKTFGLTQVGVLVQKNTSQLMLEAYAGPAMSRMTETGAARIGMSLALSNEAERRSTVGAYVEVQNPKNKQWLPMVLTCMHCVLPVPDQKIPAADKLVYDRFRQHGVGFNDDKALLWVDSPSISEVNEKIQDLRKDLEERQRNPVYQAVELDQENKVGYNSLEERTWRRVKQEMKDIQSKIDRLETDRKNGKFRLGQVFAGSGLRNKRLNTIKLKNPESTRPSIMDWALIRLVGRATGHNTSSDLKIESHRFTTLATVASPPYEHRLYKLGHTTGFTQGVHNNLLFANVARDAAGEIIVTHEQSFISRETSKSVIAPGDSGALVCDSQGEVWGVAFGGDGQGQTGYFTHILDLFEDIKSVLGTEIRVMGLD
ncbi:hypothetical protein ASPACDRAFT_45565 [Aspergillus aculeatus ATCC 16872]|uniref:Peptidase S7 domain-containing protein n=1 Tax=Aspergillus aculeatus (strain ATCC 16872 / CBS 172.66 / WB 5094) TaxID=690307 RepID=A0A1L9WMS9_ASPA1|nr:uncharacterized protein ASPACDRAFT_45565 [Aspergillus aculeatus ATCC 16872]OJJ97473.1 hypothetical protein ASPACDRAFT_45565 [Aspergillus aculeatus ATCC 16872]